MTLRVAILGSGNIGTDLLYKVARNPSLALVGIDRKSTRLNSSHSLLDRKSVV